MRKILISSFDMEIGGVERSLVNMLQKFDYEYNIVDLMLYSHAGEFMKYMPKNQNLLPEIKEYKTFRMPIKSIFKSGNLGIGVGRIISRYKAKGNGISQMQYMWKYTLPFLPKLKSEYDIAISYLWPHYFVSDKVNAKTKIAWIHTDYSKIETDVELDLKMWDKFDYLVAVSEECKESFLKKYPSLRQKLIVIENITSPEFVKELSNEDVGISIKKDKRFKLVTVARFSHAKGIDNAVKAMKLLKERGYTDLVWYVVGYGSDEVYIKTLIKEYGLEEYFILLGKQINPYPFIKQADLYVQPSRYEGKAVTVTEAQILEKPVLITNYPTARSQINEGIDGVITDLSVKGIANGIEKLYKDNELRTKLINNTKKIDYGNTMELEKLYKLF